MGYGTQVQIVKETCQHIGFHKTLPVCDSRFLGVWDLLAKQEVTVLSASYVLAFQ
jgi:hypothetical protein